MRFTLVQYDGVSFYNLAFGDWNEETSSLDDFTTTNSADVEKVLATVAAVVLDFTNHVPEAIIYAEGITPSRTRRYQMGINKAWNEINTVFDVYGIKPNDIIEQIPLISLGTQAHY